MPLVESFFDVRNIATLVSYAVLLLLTYVAVFTENRQQATVIIMVRRKYIFKINNIRKGVHIAAFRHLDSTV